MSDNVEKEPGPQPEVTTTPTEEVPEKRKREYKDFGHETEAATRSYHLIMTLPLANSTTRCPR